MHLSKDYTYKNYVVYPPNLLSFFFPLPVGAKNRMKKLQNNFPWQGMREVLQDSRIRLVDGTRGICLGSTGSEKRNHLFLEQFFQKNNLFDES